MIRVFSIAIFMFLLTGCNKLTPSGEFWKSFHEHEIYAERFDHGLYGGATEINWKREGNFKFDTKEIIEFAEENGWHFVDETNVEYVMNSDDFSYSIINKELNLNDFKNSIILRFKTNALTINEDKELDTQNNCFTILSENRDSLTVYYQWGDFL